MSYRFRKDVTIGALAAEEDAAFLRDCFIDTGLLDAILNKDDHRRILLGRTGAGKSALFMRLGEKAHTIVISPDELALDHLSNSELLKQLHDCGISLTPLYKLLWKHVFVVEVLRDRHQQLRESDNAHGFWRTFLSSFSANPTDQTRKAALEYLSEFGDKFWQTTEYRVKEVTERFEQKINAELGAKLGGISVKAGGNEGVSQEQKSAIEQVGRQFVEAIQIKKLSDVVKWLATDIEGHPPTFLILDGLDGEWAGTELRYQLIRALIETSREFMAVKNLKILIALREDLLDAALNSISEPGFQREKYAQLCYHLRWTRDELADLVETRVNKLVRETYTTAKVKLDDIIEPVGGQPGIQYLIDRTLLRPRDMIDFFNHCIRQTTDNPKITRRVILEAEPAYSVGRLNALGDEWRAVEPLVVDVAEILRGRKASIRVNELTDEAITETCQSLYIRHWNSDSPISNAAKLHCEQPLEMSADRVRCKFIDVLYRVGIIGVKPTPSEKVHWSSDGMVTIDALNLDRNCAIKVHKIFWRALNIFGTKDDADHA